MIEKQFRIVIVVISCFCIVGSITFAYVLSKKNSVPTVAESYVSEKSTSEILTSENISSENDSIDIASEKAEIMLLESAMANIKPEAVQIKPSTGNLFTAPEYKYSKKEDAAASEKNNKNVDKDKDNNSKIQQITTKPSASSKPASNNGAVSSISKPSTVGGSSAKNNSSEPVASKWVRVTADNVNIRDNPTTSGSKVLGCVKINAEYLYIGEKTDSNHKKWYNIQYNSAKAWIISDYSVVFTKSNNTDGNISSNVSSATTSSAEKYNGWTTIAGKTYYYFENAPLKGWKTIDGLRYHFNETTGLKDSLAGIDVSSYQGNINWASVKASGVEFAFIRVGYRGYETGRLCVDPKFTQNITAAQKVGLKCGVYIYSVAKTVQEAVQEANFVMEAVKNYKLDLPIVMDYEHQTDRAAGLSKAQRTNNILAFVETVQKAGYKGCLYTGYWYYNNLLEPSRLKSVPLWIAYYTENPDKVKNLQYSWWQYTSTGKINGISGNVDCNIFLPN